MSRIFKILSLFVMIALVLVACTPKATEVPVVEEPEEAEEPAEEPAVEEELGVIFFSTQFSPVEEQEKFRAILQEGGFDFTASEEGPLLTLHRLSWTLVCSARTTTCTTSPGCRPPTSWPLT